MNDRWEIVLHERPMQSLLSTRPKDRLKLMRALEDLANDPWLEADFEEPDSVGRPLHVVFRNPWQIKYWHDAAVKELRVVWLEKLSC